DVLGLDPHAEKRCQGLSKGMRQKVALAGALIHDPELIILDEPLTGLDAASARQVKKVLRARVERGVTIIMTTHILEVAERLADRIGIISAGKLVAEGTLTELRSGVAGSGAQDGQPDQALEDIFLALVAAADDAQIAQAAELEAAA
ncbi:MAG: ABC transporter ATP-binding protein, partial [Pseudomonadota bacterium]